MNKRIASLAIALPIALVGVMLTGPGVGSARADAYCLGRSAPINCWVTQPDVTRPSTAYPQITFQPGDHVLVQAGGCVQTGGRGLTWKRYVNPASDNDLYHGLISIPSVTTGLVRLSGVANRTFTVTTSGSLTLGYEDDDYSDNGYWGHDDGTGGQCRGVGPAWVHLTIT